MCGGAGSVYRVIPEPEIAYLDTLVRGVYAKSDLKAGHVLSDDDVYRSMKEFYEVKSNGADMLKDKSSKDYQTWTKKEYVKLATKNPIKYLNKTHGEFFIKKDNCALSLRDDLKKYITLETFKNHFKDIIEYRTIEYYRNRSLK